MKSIEYSMAFEAALEPWYEETSFQEASEILRSSPADELANSIANWVLKYTYMYRRPNHGNKTINILDVASEMALIDAIQSNKSGLGVMTMAEVCLADSAKTAGLVEAIINTDIPDDCLTIDMGTGTGVLAIAAQQALERQKKTGRVLGVEKEMSLVARALVLNRKYNAGQTRFEQGDTTNPYFWERAVNNETVGLIINENLPIASKRLFTPEDPRIAEPFIDNLEALSKATSLNGARHIPAQINLRKREVDEAFYQGGTFNPLSQEHRSQLLDWSKCKPEIGQYVDEIEIDGDWTPLERVGHKYYDFFDQKVFSARRW